MTQRREWIVAEARSWIGTPYRHQASVKGGGADCLGLLRGVWRVVVGPEPVPMPPYTRDWSEPSGQELLFAAARLWLSEKSAEAASPGDVILFRMREGSVAKHLGILTRSGADASFVHAFSGHGVVENSLSTPWARRVVACFGFPEGTL